MPTKDEIFEKIRTALVDVLGVDDDEVKPEATLVGDLGAESIDFLDIVFRLEKSFDIKIPRGELFPEDVLTNADYVADGKVTVSATVPPNTHGTIRLPAATLAGVTEGGLAVAAAPGVKRATQEGDDVVVEVGSGQYSLAYDAGPALLGRTTGAQK